MSESKFERIERERAARVGVLEDVHVSGGSARAGKAHKASLAALRAFERGERVVFVGDSMRKPGAMVRTDYAVVRLGAFVSEGEHETDFARHPDEIVRDNLDGMTAHALAERMTRESGTRGHSDGPTYVARVTGGNYGSKLSPEARKARSKKAARASAEARAERAEEKRQRERSARGNPDGWPRS